MRFLIYFVYVTFPSFVFLQSVDYDDVAVIVNDNSSISLNVGEYFKMQRNIPATNIIHVNAPVSETIDSVQFQAVRLQIEDYLNSNNLVNSINYIVTTKGVPLKVFKTNCQDIQCQTSFDSEISLLLSVRQNSILTGGNVLNTYYNSSEHFSKVNFDMYLVTRLDAFLETEIYDLIDRSGPNSIVNQNNALNVFDINYQGAYSGDEDYFKIQYDQVIDSLSLNGWNAVIDTLFAPLNNQSEVLLYAEFHMDSLLEDPNNNWLNGSFAELTNSFSALTFDYNGDLNYRLVLADLISEGLTSGHGYTSSTFFNSTLNLTNFENAYLDTSFHFNFAESIYKSEKFLSSQSLTIGDPKTSIVINNTLYTPKLDDSFFSIFPNPTTDFLHVKSSKKIESIVLYDLAGKLIFDLQNQQLQSIQIDVRHIAKGTYFFKLISGNQTYIEKIVKE